MLAYRDFVPRVLPKAGYFKPYYFETLDDALAAANSWIVGESVKVVTVETVVLPCIRQRAGWHAEPGTADAELSTLGFSMVGSPWYQFVRVWYEK